jgi:hypothetical protein
MFEDNTRTHYLWFTVLITALVVLLTGCPQSYYGGGGGGDDDDDDDGVGPMELTLTLRNSTGYDIIHWTLQVSDDSGFYPASGGNVDLPNGSVVSNTTTTDDVTYGNQVHISSWALDVDEWCLAWDEGGRDYNAGPELTIEIEFTDADYLDYVYDLDPAVCGIYNQ